MKKYATFIGAVVILSLPALASAAQIQVSLASGSITPATVDINAGDTVVWSNTSSATQSVMADNGSFQSGYIAPGGQFATTFNNTGTYNYYDNAQGSAILGEVVVSGTSIEPTTVETTVPTTYVNPNENYQPVTASSNSGQTAASLTSEVQSLIAEIDALEGNTSASVSTAPTYSGSSSVANTGTGACPQIGRVLSPGPTGSDVSSLQQFLAASPSIYPQGLVTGFYGSLTEQAVENWQVEYHIISAGSPSTTGFGQVGPRTAAAMAIVCGGGSYNGVGPGSSSSTEGTGVVSGFLQVSPVSGTAPLAVNVTATVNTAGDCAGATYNLDFGDGSEDQQIPIAIGDCSQGSEQFQHTYQYGGSYTITLSAEGHSSTATVTVAGPAAPQTGVTTTPVSTPTQATGSMNALVTQGSAPLTTTFYVSCASGLAFDVVFGDGTDLGGTGVSQSTCNGGLQAVTHTYEQAGTYNAQLVIFVQNSNGTVSPENITQQSITAVGTSTTNVPTNTSPGPTSYAPPALTPNYQSNPLAVELQFTALSCGQPYSVNWGDGSAAQTGPSVTCTSGTAGETTTFSPTHTYSSANQYTVTLERPIYNGTYQTDTVAVAITTN